jgi:hypothetical protein
MDDFRTGAVPTATKKFALCYFASEFYHNGYVINAPRGKADQSNCNAL